MPSGPNYELVANGKWENERLLESIQNCLIAFINKDLSNPVFPNGPTYQPAQGENQGEPFLYGSIQNLLGFWVTTKAFLVPIPDGLKVPLPYQQYTTNAILQATQSLMAYIIRANFASPNPGTPTYQPMVGITQTDDWYLTAMQNITRSWAIGLSVTLPSDPQYQPFLVTQATDNKCLWSMQNMFTQFPM